MPEYKGRGEHVSRREYLTILKVDASKSYCGEYKSFIVYRIILSSGIMSVTGTKHFLFCKKKYYALLCIIERKETYGIVFIILEKLRSNKFTL